MGEGGQDRGLAGFAAQQGDRAADDGDGGEERHGEQDPAHLLEQDRQLDEAKRRAARLGKRAGSIDEQIRTIGEQIAAKKKEKTAAEKEIEGLTTELKAATALLYKVSRREERIALGARPILGKVTQLHPDDGAVSLDVGNRHGVGVGDPFFVARGPQYVGKVVVTEVEIERCRAAPKTEAMKGEIKVGDAVSSRLAMDAAEGSKP